MVVWNKSRMGMGYRTRRITEFLVVAQKPPKRAKGVWSVHNIPDNIVEKVGRNGHTHTKPVQMQAALISAVSNPGDVIIDPAAGSFSVLEACERTARKFLGCDLNGDFTNAVMAKNGGIRRVKIATRRSRTAFEGGVRIGTAIGQLCISSDADHAAAPAPLFPNEERQAV